MKQDASCKEAEEIAAEGVVSDDHFIWHPVTRAVGNVKQSSSSLLVDEMSASELYFRASIHS